MYYTRITRQGLTAECLKELTAINLVAVVANKIIKWVKSATIGIVGGKAVKLDHPGTYTLLTNNYFTLRPCLDPYPVWAHRVHS